MKNWQIINISKTYLSLFDGPHATPKPSAHGKIFLRIENITDVGHLDFSKTTFISEEDFPRWTKRVKPKENDLVFSYEATLGRYAIIPKNFEGCLGRRIALIRPNNKIAYFKFLYYYFFSNLWKQEVSNYLITGATVDRIPLIKFSKFKILLPPLPIQQKIAAVLSAYDDLIENNNRRIALLEKMAEELYREWFVRLRFPGHDQVKIVKGVPEGWEVKKLSEIVELAYGKALKEENRLEGQIPVYGSSGIVGNHNQAIVTGPGIIVGRKGNVGKVLWAPTDFYPIDTVYYVKSRYPFEFIYYLLQTMNFINNDAAVPGLNRQQAYSNKFYFPPDLHIKNFEKIIQPIFKSIENLSQINYNLSNSRDRLLSRLMSGKIDLEHLDIAFPPSMQAENHLPEEKSHA